MENEDLKMIKAMLVIIAKRIEDLRRQVKGGMSSKSEQAWLNDLEKDARRIVDKLD